MKVAVAIASHERIVPLQVVLRCLPAHWHAVVVLTDGEDPAHYTGRANTHVFHHPNQPLGAKWQHAVDQARALDPDLLIITGSDDVLVVDEAILQQQMSTVEMLGLRGWYVYENGIHYRCVYAPHIMMPIGGGRVYTKALLNRMRWRLFNPTLNRHLDEQGYHNALRAGGNIAQVEFHEALTVVAIKGPWQQMNPLAKYQRSRNVIVTQVNHVRHRVHYQW